MEYSILIDRYLRDEGLLTYTHGDEIIVQATCWFDPATRIPPKTYKRCSKAFMPRAFEVAEDGTRKVVKDTQWQAILIPRVSGFKGIYIHQGNNAVGTQGCIVLPWADLIEIWTDIEPMDGKNVTVDVNNF